MLVRLGVDAEELMRRLLWGQCRNTNVSRLAFFVCYWTEQILLPRWDIMLREFVSGTRAEGDCLRKELYIL